MWYTVDETLRGYLICKFFKLNISIASGWVTFIGLLFWILIGLFSWGLIRNFA